MQPVVAPQAPTPSQQGKLGIGGLVTVELVAEAGGSGGNPPDVITRRPSARIMVAVGRMMRR